MFRRESTETETETRPEPASRREPVDPKDAAIFTQGKTFAERKADAEARNAARTRRRLVSLGETEFAERDRRGETTYRPATLYADADHPQNRYVEIDGVPGLHPLQSDDRRDEVVKIPGPALRRTGRGPSALRQLAPPDLPTRRV